MLHSGIGIETPYAETIKTELRTGNVVQLLCLLEFSNHTEDRPSNLQTHPGGTCMLAWQRGLRGCGDVCQIQAFGTDQPLLLEYSVAEAKPKAVYLLCAEVI